MAGGGDRLGKVWGYERGRGSTWAGGGMGIEEADLIGVRLNALGGREEVLLSQSIDAGLVFARRERHKLRRAQVSPVTHLPAAPVVGIRPCSADSGG